jgi:hypothetical protein
MPALMRLLRASHHAPLGSPLALWLFNIAHIREQSRTVFTRLRRVPDSSLFEPSLSRPSVRRGARHGRGCVGWGVRTAGYGTSSSSHLGTVLSRKGWFLDAPHCVIGEQPMLPLLALTYTAARLGFEAQSAATFRLLRLGAGITKGAEEIVPEASVPPADIAPAPVATAPKRRHAAKKIHKKSAPVGKRSKRTKRA